ncbi:hypothetical protein [Prochlorococcus marinus]|uniref:hypothetical protein n=1 Tax=Prochlorococcus marinus TaxID=1219 RepID=UPI0039AF0F9A
MENQELTQAENNSSTAILETTEIDIDNDIASVENQVNVLEAKKIFSTDQDEITSIIEGAFPSKATNTKLASRQSNSFDFVGRIFFLWVWPIVLHNKIRNLINNLNFAQSYSDPGENTYSVKDTETVYTMTKDAFSGKGGMKFMGIRFMAIWVFPFAITGAVMEFLFVGPLMGTNPFG